MNLRQNDKDSKIFLKNFLHIYKSCQRITKLMNGKRTSFIFNDFPTLTLSEKLNLVNWIRSNESKTRVNFFQSSKQHKSWRKVLIPSCGFLPWQNSSCKAQHTVYMNIYCAEFDFKVRPQHLRKIPQPHELIWVLM